jgi:hypothetical protein
MNSLIQNITKRRLFDGASEELGFIPLESTSPALIYYGILKRWNGSEWVKTSLKTYNGTWVSKPLKRWDGAQWLDIDITGI